MNNRPDINDLIGGGREKWNDDWINHHVNEIRRQIEGLNWHKERRGGEMPDNAKAAIRGLVCRLHDLVMEEEVV